MSADREHRERILARLRRARPTAPPPAAKAAPAPNFWRAPPEGDLQARFARELGALRGEFLTAPDEAAAAELLRAESKKAGWRSAVFAHTEAARLLDPAGAATLARLGAALGARPLSGDAQGGAALAAADVGLTGCDALVAVTGSVVLTSRSAAGRALSVVPPVHVVVARATQLVPTLTEAYALVRDRYAASAEGWPSLVCTITGPSRTADIEKILVMGAHGPKRLIVILLP